MNIKKLNKADLISKIRKLESKNSSNNNNQIKLVELFNLLKSWIMKLTLIALIIKYFKNIL